MPLKEASFRFESLGHNCEFGFALRKLGNEAGGLLRWAITPPGALVNLLDAGPRKLYLHDNLEPTEHDMVLDRGTGISFHCGFRFERNNGAWVPLDTQSDIESIYNKDREKIEYMGSKFFRRLGEPGVIFVYKHQHSLGAEVVRDLYAALRRSGGRDDVLLLVVEETGDMTEAGTVGWLAHGIMLGLIGQFVDNKYSRLANYEEWHQIMRGALALVASVDQESAWSQSHSAEKCGV